MVGIPGKELLQFLCSSPQIPHESNTERLPNGQASKIAEECVAVLLAGDYPSLFADSLRACVGCELTDLCSFSILFLSPAICTCWQQMKQA